MALMQGDMPGPKREVKNKFFSDEQLGKGMKATGVPEQEFWEANKGQASEPTPAQSEDGGPKEELG